MKLLIEITCDNAAFNDDDSNPDVGNECARILRELAEKFEYVSSPADRIVFDVNGNRVGQAEFVA